MGAPLYRIMNSASAGAAAPVKQPTGSAIRTMLQYLNSTQATRIVEWGISFDGTTAATPIEVELCSTGTTAATMSTALVANDITQLTDPLGNAPQGLTLTTSGCGFATGAVTEGSPAAPIRSLDHQLISPANQYLKQFPEGQEPVIDATKVLRVRVTAAATVNCYIYIVFAVG